MLVPLSCVLTNGGDRDEEEEEEEGEKCCFLPGLYLVDN
jgi:hypothetical protein